MPVEKIILNASPLILLCNSELSFILRNYSALPAQRRSVTAVLATATLFVG
jgi:hypothetical protein